MNIWKRMGNILLSIMPLVVTIVVQFIVSIVLMLATAAAVAASGTGGFLIDSFFGRMFDIWMTPTFNGILSIVYAILALLIFGFWYWKMDKGGMGRVRAEQSMNLQILVPLALLAVGLQYLSGFLTAIAGALQPGWMESYKDLVESSGITEGSFLMSVYSCVLAPISEECTFRGVSYSYAQRGLPIVLATALQALLFGVFHLNMIQGIYAAFLGLFLGYVCWKGGSLFLSILFHAAFNIIGTFFSRYLYFGMEGEMSGILFAFLGAALTLAGLRLFGQGVKRRDMMGHEA